MTDKDQKKFINDLVSGKQKTLKMDEKFKFKCTACGKCCFNIDVMLNVYDLIRLRHSLKLPTQEIFKKDLVNFYLGPSSGLPVLTISFKKFGESSTKCPFLAPAINADDALKKIMVGKTKEEVDARMEEYRANPQLLAEAMKGVKIDRWLCMVHKDRPIICKLFPCGRFQRINPKNPKDIQEMFVLQEDEASFCPGFTENYEQTLKQFLDDGNFWQSKEGSATYKSIMDQLMLVGLFAPTKDNEKQIPPSRVIADSASLKFVANIIYNFDSINAFSKDPRVGKTIFGENATHEDFMYVNNKVLEVVKGFCALFATKKTDDLNEFLRQMAGGGESNNG